MKTIGAWFCGILCGATLAGAAPAPDPAFVLSADWRLQDATLVTAGGEQLSRPDFAPVGWRAATVPGTVLTSLVNDGVYPEPLFGENNRPDKIPESLCRTDWWYRTAFVVPQSYAGRAVWLCFDGINYAAEVWVNGTRVGAIKGAFARGRFDISSLVEAGKIAAVAVRVSPPPDPGVPHEHTINQGMGGNGGITALDGPNFLCTIGWDWIPAIRDRDTGIWQRVYLAATGPAAIRDPVVTTELPLPRLDSADVTVKATVENTTGTALRGVLKGTIEDVSFEMPVDLPAEDSRVVSFDPARYPQLHLAAPRLWWPNGYGRQDLYTLHLEFETGGTVSDAQDVSFGIRKITYDEPDSKNLVLKVNGVRIFAKGGDWGMDEAMKRIPRERLEAEIRMHQLANYTMIRNWVGQSTGADFYDLCDKYGILIWDEFFQPNPSDGPVPADHATYLANVREKVLRFRNHPSIAVWCAQNEGTPPKEIDDALRGIMAELDPVRHYQPNSNAGNGVHSGGPYSWRKPGDYYVYPADEAFKTEIGSVSIPTLESIQGMMPAKDWEVINDDWAEHDFAAGAQAGDSYLDTLGLRYGKPANLADFVRKAQLMNYEAFRAMYEGREAKLFHPVTGVLTWMSNPAQPSFVWQLYHHDLEPNAALFATREACEPVHIQLNEKDETIQIVNGLPESLSKARVRIVLFNLDGSSPYQGEYQVDAAGDAVTDLGSMARPVGLSSVYFVKLELRDAGGELLSENFYWRALPPRSDDLTALGTLPVVKLDAKVVRHDQDGKCLLNVTLRNPGPGVALMAHLQLRRGTSQERVLPVYYSGNYLSFATGEEKTVTIEAAQEALRGETPCVLVDGWNIAVDPVSSADATVALNTNAQVDHWAKNGLRISYGPPLEALRNHCGGAEVGDFRADGGFTQSQTQSTRDSVDSSVPLAGPAALYQSARSGNVRYTFPMRSLAAGHSYVVRLHFAEFTYREPGRRKFNVEINGKRVLTDFDIVGAAGSRDKAVVQEFDGVLPNSDGNVVVRLSRGSADSPVISGIEILPRATPIIRDPHTPGYVMATELPDGVNPPADTDGNFIIGPTHTRAPEMTAQAGVPQGMVYDFTISSTDSKIFPGIAREPNTFGTVDPADPAKLVVSTSHPAPYVRRVAVYVPKQYVPGSVAPFIMGTDGPDRGLFTALDNLIAAHRVPVMIAISLGNGSGDAQGSERGLEYDTMSGRYAEFVEKEVLPLVEKRFNVKLTDDPEGRATMGGSSGGSCALIMAWYHPELYHRVLTYSGTYVNQQWPYNAETPHGAWEFHEHLIPDSPVKPLRIWMEVGDRDLFNPNIMRDNMHDWVVANESMAKALAAKGYRYQFVFARNAGHTDRAVKAQTLPEALEWLWKGYGGGAK